MNIVSNTIFFLFLSDRVVGKDGVQQLMDVWFIKVEAWFLTRSQYISCSCREAFHGDKE
jgi:hypothetical protein